jgi:signal transduction histidine kinase
MERTKDDPEPAPAPAAADARERLRDRAAQEEKMEALGRFAGGLAHDLNNLLTVINGYTEILLGRAGPEDPSRRLLDEIRKAGDRSADLTRRLLAVGKRQALAARDLDLNQAVRGAVEALRRAAGEGVRVETALHEHPIPVRTDPVRLERALLELAGNARDAMPAGGTLSLRTEVVEVDEERASGTPDLRPGRYALLSVADTGQGMTEDVRRRAFEPFFTTKPKGKGTGLGLAEVHGLLRQGGGTLEAESAPGRGSTIRMWLPLAVPGGSPPA